MPFTFLEHTGDARVECRADTLAGLFEASARALYALAFKRTARGGGAQRRVTVRGATREEALVRWLQELIFLMDADRFAASAFRFEKDGEDGELCANLEGYEYDPADRAEEVKSATYHGIEVKETGEGYVAHIVFDL